ncbi:MAG: 3-isopropylmalate dehydratase small subunit [Gammaproteobacteria bacterium]|nr:3-isopropylmalate dehydratase small subunit [Gammaproteobacteria bacterium]NNL99800.1 3-isopropylmalate dehydratase small subunit [Gammaproteobacteria bacterium]
MQAFVTHSGIAAPLLRANIDTDAIIPSREMKRVSKHGLSDGLFAGWRYRYDGSERPGPDPDFILNQPPYDRATILIGGNNFGCGSSREHAVWALAEFGFRAIIAPGFGAIFQGNCIRNGILPVVLDEAAVARLGKLVGADPERHTIAIDLVAQRIDCADVHADFDISASQRELLLGGIDFIDATLQFADEISAFEHNDRRARAWAWLPDPRRD